MTSDTELKAATPDDTPTQAQLEAQRNREENLRHRRQVKGRWEQRGCEGPRRHQANDNRRGVR